MFNDSSILVKQRKERDRIKSKIEIKVTKEGFEPSRPCEHHPLKMASLPFLHLALKQQRRCNATSLIFL